MKSHARLAAAAIAATAALALPLPAAPQEADPQAPQTVVLKPHFTERSKKIVVPRDATVYPEIRDGLIALRTTSDYSEQTLYVRPASGEYAWGTDSYLKPLDDLYLEGDFINASRYFSGGALMTRRSKPNTSAPFIAYPNGTYREFPTGSKDAAGRPNDINRVFDFVEGYAMIDRGTNSGKWSKDAKGKLVWVVAGNRTLSFIDKDGKSAFPQLTSKTGDNSYVDMRVRPLRENRRAYYNAELKKYGYADAKGAIAIRPQFDRAANFSDGMAAVMNKDENGDEKWGFVDSAGKMAVPATYRMQPRRFKEGLAAVRIGRDSNNYEMTYIDKTGKRAMESRPWALSEFTDGFAWAHSGDRLFVINKDFEEVRDLTKVLRGGKTSWMWIDFPGGTRACNSGGVSPGNIFAPDGTMLFTCTDSRNQSVPLHDVTDGGLMFCQPYFKDEPHLKGKSVELPCFINKEGEVVYYFEVGVEGYEGKKPVEIKGAAAPAQQTRPAGK